MEILNSISAGLGTAISIGNLSWCLIGVTLGTLVGVLPGLGTMAAVSILLPFTYNFGDPSTAIIFMAGIYYGTQYGGSTTSILLRLPGEASSVVTTLDGYAMTQRGRGGAALAIAAMASFIAGTFATLLLALLAQPLSELAFVFGPTEYASLMLLGLLASVSLSQGSFTRGLGAVLIGILLGLVGTDINSGLTRFTMGIPELMDGISFAVIAMGVFGLAEVLYTILHEKAYTFEKTQIKNLYPNRAEIRDSTMPAMRGTIIGSILGLLPGGGAIISSFASYAVEKKLSRNPEKFGHGHPAGVAGPEAANNAGAQTSFIPMLSLGVPTNPVMALMLATLMIHNIQPGPTVISSNPGLFWGLIISMWVGNFFLLILNLPLVGIWVSILRVPRWILYICILGVCVIGTYSINNNWFDVALLIPFTMLGYLFRVLGCEAAPLAMGFIVGTMFEEHLRRSLMISNGDWMTFLQHPISAAMICTAVLLILVGWTMKEKNKNG